MKLPFQLLFLFVMLWVTSCNTSENNPIKHKIETTKDSIAIVDIPDKYCNTLDSLFNFHQDTLYYQNTKFSGYAFTLYPSKDTAFIGSYLNGLEEGLQQKNYNNKKVAETRYYHKGKKENVHLGYWEDGKPKFEYHFLNGEQHGIEKEWYQNGQPYKVFHYENGYESGSQKMWWENGVIRANYVVKNGRRYGLVGLKLCMNPMDTVQLYKK